MSEKLYISITGSTGAGKSTLLAALIEVLGERAQIIPQTTSRLQRTDDSLVNFRFLPDEKFSQQQFFVSHDRYGIASSDYENFITSQKSTGLSVNGANEIQKMSLKSPEEMRSRAFNILLTYSSGVEEELKYLGQNVRVLFNQAQAEKRLISNKSLCEDFFFNPDFTDKCINLHLRRDEPLQEWARKINQALPELGLEEGHLVRILGRNIQAMQELRPSPPSGNKLSPK